jgi:DNA-binding GntR family transcriptional regulator
MILSGEIAPGEQLVQQSLAKQIGTSHIPVIEAIRRLESDGLVVCQSKWGAHARVWTPEDIEAAYVMRASLEGYACRLFVDQASRAQRYQLQELGREFDEFSAIGDRTSCINLDIKLHLHIINSTNSDFLRQFAENSQIVVAVIRNTLKIPPPTGSVTGPNGVHDSLIAALMGDDPVLAEREGSDHVRLSGERVIQYLKRQEKVGRGV